MCFFSNQLTKVHDRNLLFLYLISICCNDKLNKKFIIAAQYNKLARKVGRPGPPHFSCQFFFFGPCGLAPHVERGVVLLGLARAVAHSYERERGVVRDTI